MKLVIYLGEDNIKVVLGRRRKQLWIKTCQTYELPKGTLINDVITDQAAFSSVLKEIAKIYHFCAGQVHLVLGSNKIITRMMKVPSMSEKSLLEISKKELNSYLVSGEEDMVYDYGRVNQESILCAASQRKFVEIYCRLFRRCGLKVKTIDAALNSVASFAEYLPLLKGQTYILAVLDGRNMISSLYVKGKYIYTSRLRLVSERETQEICREIVGQMGAVKRFGESQNKDASINHIYLCGLSQLEEKLLYPAAKSVLNVDASGLNLYADGIGEDVSSYIYASGCLISRRHKKYLNLVKASNRKSAKETAALLKITMARVLPLLIAVYFAGRFYIRVSEISRFQKETTVIYQFLDDSSKAAEIDAAKEESREIDELKDMTATLEEEAAFLEEYPQISGDIMKFIENAGEGRVTFRDFSYSNGQLTFTAMMENLGEGAEFASRLEKSGIFERVGYHRMEKKEQYCFYMECIIKKTSERSGL